MVCCCLHCFAIVLRGCGGAFVGWGIQVRHLERSLPFRRQRVWFGPYGLLDPQQTFICWFLLSMVSLRLLSRLASCLGCLCVLQYVREDSLCCVYILQYLKEHSFYCICILQYFSEHSLCCVYILQYFGKCSLFHDTNGDNLLEMKTL